MESILIRALRGERTERVPFWYMRQAGRYLPEYNELRRGRTFIEVMESPDLAFEISMQPFRRFKMDGVILFSDILTPVRGAGIPLHFEEKKGPVLERTINSSEDLAIFRDFRTERDCPYVPEILRRLKSRLSDEQERPALIGFAGAPFTLASYLVEGGGTQKFEKTKQFLFQRTELFLELSQALTEMTIEYLTAQIRAGADAVQVFDSWGGILSPAHYREFSAPFTRQIINAIRNETKVPVILFVGSNSHLLNEITEQNPHAVSLDWRVSPESALSIPARFALQGNLDPLVLYGTPARTAIETRNVLQAFASRQGYVFNLGHGIHPASAIENVETMVRTVREFRS